jgi:hypothetical protein
MRMLHIAALSLALWASTATAQDLPRAPQAEAGAGIAEAPEPDQAQAPRPPMPQLSIELPTMKIEVPQRPGTARALSSRPSGKASATTTRTLRLPLAGAEAVKALGQHLPAVAAHYGRTPEQLRDMLLTDPSARIDQAGRILFVDHAPSKPAPWAEGARVAEKIRTMGTRSGAEGAATGGATTLNGPEPIMCLDEPDRVCWWTDPDEQFAPLDQTFRLHSRPGSKRTLYLNFRGKVLTGTGWNYVSGRDPMVADAFDMDGDPKTFSAAERKRIQTTWRRVADAFATRDINVTTERPPLHRLQRASLEDQEYGGEVLITRNEVGGLYDCGTGRYTCAGSATVGAFDRVADDFPDDKTALVFFWRPQSTQVAGAGEMANTAIHEAGHMLGLWHHGTTAAGWKGASEYYLGHWAGREDWSAFMSGVGSGRLAQWSRGDYPGANRPDQDDFKVMGQHGVAALKDDHGSRLSTASKLTPAASGDAGAGRVALQRTGIIETRQDIDVFSFEAGAGRAVLTVELPPFNSSLDARLDLFDSDGRRLLSKSPLDPLDVTMAVRLPRAGTYFVAVQGVGKAPSGRAPDSRGTPDYGYSDYGSVGAYTMHATVPEPGGLAPVAAIQALGRFGKAPLQVSFSGEGSSDPDSQIVSYEWDFGDGSPRVQGATATHTFTRQGSFEVSLKVMDSQGFVGYAVVRVGVR